MEVYTITFQFTKFLNLACGKTAGFNVSTCKFKKIEIHMRDAYILFTIEACIFSQHLKCVLNFICIPTQE